MGRLSDIRVHHLEISLLITLLTDNAQSYNKMLLLCVCVCVCVFMLVSVSFGVVVNQLKSLLLKQCREIPAPLSPSKKHSPSKVPITELSVKLGYVLHS